MIQKQMYSFLCHPHDLPRVIDTTIQVGDVSITSSQSVGKLGIVLDQTLSMKQHITHVCKSAFVHLPNIRYLKPYLSADAFHNYDAYKTALRV